MLSRPDMRVAYDTDIPASLPSHSGTAPLERRATDRVIRVDEFFQAGQEELSLAGRQGRQRPRVSGCRQWRDTRQERQSGLCQSYRLETFIPGAVHAVDQTAGHQPLYDLSNRRAVHAYHDSELGLIHDVMIGKNRQDARLDRRDVEAAASFVEECQVDLVQPTNKEAGPAV